MSSTQNPIHRDRDKRGKGEGPFQDDKEAFRKQETDGHIAPPAEAGQDTHLTEEKREELPRQNASELLAAVRER